MNASIATTYTYIIKSQLGVRVTMSIQHHRLAAVTMVILRWMNWMLTDDPERRRIINTVNPLIFYYKTYDMSGIYFCTLFSHHF